MIFSIYRINTVQKHCGIWLISLRTVLSRARTAEIRRRKDLAKDPISLSTPKYQTDIMGKKAEKEAAAAAVAEKKAVVKVNI